MSEVAVVSPEELQNLIRNAVCEGLDQSARPIETEEPRLLTVDQACERLSVSRTTLYHLRRSGRIRAVTALGRTVRFRSQDVERLMDNGREVRRYNPRRVSSGSLK